MNKLLLITKQNTGFLTVDDETSNDREIRKLNDQAYFKQWFERAYNEHFERMYRYAFSITKSKDLAEDVVAEVFLHIWEKQDGHNHIKELQNYLYVSVKHAAIRIASKNPHQFLYSSYQETMQVADDIDPETILLGDELQQIINKAVSSLSPHCSLVYDLIKNKGKSYQEVANEMGVSKKTVEGHICKALSTIRKELQDYFNGSSRIKWISGSAFTLLLIFISFATSQ